MNIVIMCCPGREEMVTTLRAQLRGAIVIEVWDANREGSLPCALRALDMGLDCFKNQPFTVLQDDVEVCQGFSEYVDTFTGDVLVKDLVIQWYAHGWVAGAIYRAAHFAEFGGHDYVCSLATTYSPHWAEKVRDHLQDIVDHPDGHKDDKGQLQGDDAAIADVLAWERKEFFVHIPSLVQHIGHESMVAGRQVSLESHDARTSRCYVGIDFDARKLLDVVSVPWRAPNEKEKTIMDEKEKTIGEMTIREFYAAVKTIEADDDDGNSSSIVSSSSAPSTAKSTNCNTCGDTSGDCGHGTKVAVKRGQPDSE